MNRIASVSGLCIVAAAIAAGQSGYGAPFQFSGATWVPKIASSKVGPGPNFFSPSNVSVDAQGRLHLKIAKIGAHWQCAEVVMQGTPGYGTYRFYVDSPLNNLDPSVVLGMFTWSDNSAYNHREMDIEFAKWGVANNNNGWYTVQPYNVAGQQVSFAQGGYPQSTHILDWAMPLVGQYSAHFQSLGAFATAPSATAPLIADHTFNSGVPPSGDENVRINLWLFRGKAPKAPVEIIIHAVDFPGKTP